MRFQHRPLLQQMLLCILCQLLLAASVSKEEAHMQGALLELPLTLKLLWLKILLHLLAACCLASLRRRHKQWGPREQCAVQAGRRRFQRLTSNQQQGSTRRRRKC